MWTEKGDGGGGGGGKEAGRWRVTASHWCAFSCVGINHDLRNDIFSHPSNKLYIQQIAGLLPNHFFPPAVSQKSHLVGLDYRDIMQEMYVYYKKLKKHLRQQLLLYLKSTLRVTLHTRFKLEHIYISHIYISFFVCWHWPYLTSWHWMYFLTLTEVQLTSVWVIISRVCSFMNKCILALFAKVNRRQRSDVGGQSHPREV